MKILHTADWHLGKMLHKQSLAIEMQLFLSWLVNFIKAENIDLLLVSGDVFDVANPSSKDREIYFKFLGQLHQMGIRSIFTGGNHDSIGVLNAPAELLEYMGITIVGGATDPIVNELIEIKNSKGNLQAVVAAVPFLRDKDLRKLDKNTATDRREAIREGMMLHYKILADHCEKYSGKVPIIAMGHLYAKGAVLSESERDIGNQTAISASIFSDIFDYVALGHIHRPQIVAKNDCIRYSGSPIALSFSEKADNKVVMLIETNGAKVVKVKSVPVPKQRMLSRISGDLDSVALKLEDYKSETELPDFIELLIKAPVFSHSLIMDIESLILGYQDQEDFVILKHSFEFAENSKKVNDFFAEGIQIEEMKPMDIFNTKLEVEENINDGKKQQLKELFKEILIDIQQTD